MRDISRRRDSIYDELNSAITEGSERILTMFRKIAVSGVKDPKLLAILKDVEEYWRDSFRPALTSLSCEAVGGNPKTADYACLMFTMASAGFGLHDDIIDRSTNKHVRMTIVGIHGVDSALLAGDLLMYKAWSTVCEMIRKPYPPETVAAIVETYGDLAVEFCEAELKETFCRRKLETDLEYYKSILWGAMAEMEACARVGAIIGGGEKDEVEALAEFGRRLGFMSRLGDDVEDCLNLKGDLVHRLEYESVPLPLLYSAQYSNENFLQIKGIIEKPQIEPLDARELVRQCFETNAFEYMRKTADENREKAASKLALLKRSKARDLLAVLNKRSYRHIRYMCETYQIAI